MAKETLLFSDSEYQAYKAAPFGAHLRLILDHKGAFKIELRLSYTALAVGGFIDEDDAYMWLFETAKKIASEIEPEEQEYRLIDSNVIHDKALNVDWRHLQTFTYHQ